jgi:hypothetical protein
MTRFGILFLLELFLNTFLLNKSKIFILPMLATLSCHCISFVCHNLPGYPKNCHFVLYSASLTCHLSFVHIFASKVWFIIPLRSLLHIFMIWPLVLAKFISDTFNNSSHWYQFDQISYFIPISNRLSGYWNQPSIFFSFSPFHCVLSFVGWRMLNYSCRLYDAVFVIEFVSEAFQNAFSFLSQSSIRCFERLWKQMAGPHTTSPAIHLSFFVIETRFGLR